MIHRERLRAPEYIYAADEWRLVEKAFYPPFLPQSETLPYEDADPHVEIAGQRIDADLIQRESARMIDSLDRQLGQHGQQMQNQLTAELKKYFDPQDGHFPQRVERLVRRDGELEEVLRRQIDGEQSALAKTLVEHVGENSPLMKVLSPDESQFDKHVLLRS